jgi:uncharacterized protein (TIGR00369 family)
MISPAPIFGALMPIEVLQRGDGRFVTATTFAAQHLNAVGAVHGGLIAALLDIGLAGGGAASLNDGEGSYGITLSITVNFVQPLPPGRATCAAGVVGGGRQTKFVEARLTGPDGALAATASGTVRVIERPEPSVG